jgi:hypothetical protein
MSPKERRSFSFGLVVLSAELMAVAATVDPVPARKRRRVVMKGDDWPFLFHRPSDTAGLRKKPGESGGSGKDGRD